MKLGSFSIDIISDGTFALDGGAMFGVVPRVLWERPFPPDQANRIRLGLNTLLVRTGRENVLVDTGIGFKWDPRSIEIYGIRHETALLEELRKAGTSPEEIDIVINSHLHFDHSGTNTVLEGSEAVPAFPRARYIMQAGELAHARSPHERDRASYLPENFEPLARAGQIETVDGDADIVPGISVIRVGGHNRDLQCVRIDSEGETAFFFADLIPTTAHLRPAWIMGYDLYPVDTLDRKKQILPQAVAEDWICVFEHDPSIPAGRLRETEGKITVEPVKL